MVENFLLKSDSKRRFGVEIELNSKDGRDFKKNPLEKGEHPLGMVEFSKKCTKFLKNYYLESNQSDKDPTVQSMGWHHTHNNQNWRIKPDSSCGMELCSPVMSGWSGLEEVCKVVGFIGDVASFPQRGLVQRSAPVRVDSRCSFHCHIDVSDLSDFQVANILKYWIKCESVFLDSVPADRKVNRYCQAIGLTDLFEHDSEYSDREIINLLGTMKYYSLNTYHKCRGNRDTIEFRIIESDGCVKPFLVKNWIKLLLHFVDVSSWAAPPKSYECDDPWSSFLWLDPDEVLYFLGFNHEDYVLSKGMEQVRNWFLSRLKKNIFDSNSQGIWSNLSRSQAKEKLDEAIKSIGLNENDLLEFSNDEKKLYGRKYRF